MIRLFKVREKQRELAENNNGKTPVKKQSAGELRIHKDMSELNLPKSCKISFTNGKDDLMNFEVTIRPDEGYYLGGTFVFFFTVPSVYPHEPPKVYHPNIDLEGNVCLNILREDWKPVLNINTIIYGLYHLFTQPNHEDPLNEDAAKVLRDNPSLFASNVKRAMAGGYVGQTSFPRSGSANPSPAGFKLQTPLNSIFNPLNELFVAPCHQFRLKCQKSTNIFIAKPKLLHIVYLDSRAHSVSKLDIDNIQAV
ncbi:hypothetical protein V2J09_001921 [Rumex salicifolius]